MEFYPNRDSRTLSDSHRHTLEVGSAICREAIEARGVWSIERPSELPEGYNERQRRRAPGMLFQLHRPNGETATVFRPDTPYPDKPNWKYEQMPKSSGGGNCLDVHPWCQQYISDLSVPVIFCEGTKKADALVTAFKRAGLPVVVVCIVGVWNWVEDGCKPIADMFDILLEGRSVTIIFDSDLLRKWQVQLAARRLADHAQGRGASVYMTYLQDLPNGQKCGADDFFAQGGTLMELRLLTRRYAPEDFAHIRLSRDAKLRTMIEDLGRTYEAMPASKRGQCSDRATMRYLIDQTTSGKVHLSETSEASGIVVRAPIRRMSLSTRMGRQAQSNSLRRLEKRGYLTRIEEPKRKIERRGAAYLLYASCTESALSGHLRREGDRDQHKAKHKKSEEREGNPHSYADSYAGVHVTRSPSADVPELRAPKIIHTWERKDGRRVVVDSQYFYRLDKLRQEVVMYLLDAGGEAHEEDLLERFGSASTRMRDFRKRKLSPLLGWRYTRDKETRQEVRVETGPPIIERGADGTVRVLPEWRAALEEHRRATDEDGDTERQAKKYRKQSEDYRNRDRTPADEQPNPLLGKERNKRNVAARAREDRQRWVEEQRQKVGTTALTFLADEIDGEYGVRFQDAADRWHALKGGSASDLWRAVHYGPFVFRRVQGDLFIDPEPPVGNLEPKPAKATPPPERKMLQPNEDGIYVHGGECDCWLCEDDEVVA
jgi:Domain of unknown function (DUF3854)